MLELNLDMQNFSFKRCFIHDDRLFQIVGARGANSHFQCHISLILKLV